MFTSFGVKPALGRVFSENDDLTPGAHPYAVLSYDYWTRRFGRDPNVVGRTFRTGDEIYQIVGVSEGPFTGTEPGTVTDIFVPTMMAKYNATARSDYSWFRTFVKLKPGAAVEPVRDRLRASFRSFQQVRVKELSGDPEAGSGFLFKPKAPPGVPPRQAFLAHKRTTAARSRFSAAWW